jgi:hypothetical protein
MSKVIMGVIDLPHVDLSDTETIYELILFLQSESLFPKEWRVTRQKDGIFIKHTEKEWTWIKISSKGKIMYDNHYGITEKAKDRLLSLIGTYYPAFRKAIDVLSEARVNQYRMSINKKKEEIVIEIEDLAA